MDTEIKISRQQLTLILEALSHLDNLCWCEGYNFNYEELQEELKNLK